MKFTLIGRYQWVKEIGEGGFGAVELYRDLLTGEDVAIKTIPAMYVNQESKRLVREVDIMRFLHDAHPHLIGFFYMFATASVTSGDKKRWHGSVPPTPPEMNVLSQEYASLSLFEKLQRHHQYLTTSVQNLRSSSDFNIHIVMPLMSGDLFYFIKLIADPARAKVAITPEYLGPVAAVYAFQVCFGLDYLHQCGIVHRDMKPDNVLVRLDVKNPYMSTALIADMGLARDTGDSETFYVCTRYYRPPDVVMGFSKGASATDIWSLGCIFYELCTCQTLFTMKSALNDHGTWDGYYASRQLEVILNIMGCPTPEEVERHAPKDTNAKSYLMRSAARPCQLDTLLRNNWKLHVSEHEKMLWIDLIKSCLRFFPQQRPTAAQLCCHPLFRELNMFYGENVCQVGARPYHPLYDEKHMSNQNRAENKHATLGLIAKALEMTVPEEELDDEEEEEEDDFPPQQQQPLPPRRLDDDGVDRRQVSLLASDEVGGISAYQVRRVSGMDEDDDIAQVAPSIYAASGLQGQSLHSPEDEEHTGSILRQAGPGSLFDARPLGGGGGGGAVIENEESGRDEDNFLEASSSDSEEGGVQDTSRRAPYAYPSAFLRPSATNAASQSTKKSSRSVPRGGSSGGDDAGGSSLAGGYAVSSMFKHPSSSAQDGKTGSGKKKNSSSNTMAKTHSSGVGDEEDLEPATLLRRTYSGSGNAQAPYSFIHTMSLASSGNPPSSTEDTARKPSTNANGASLLPPVPVRRASRSGVEQKESDLQYQYPQLNDVYGSMKNGEPAPQGRAQTGEDRAHPQLLNTSAGAPSFSFSTYTVGTEDDTSTRHSASTLPITASQKAADGQAGHYLPSAAPLGRDARDHNLSKGSSGWSMKAPQFQSTHAPVPVTTASDVQSAAATAAAAAAGNGGANGGSKNSNGDDTSAYSYFDGDVLQDYGEGHSLVQSTAAAAAAASTSRLGTSTARGSSQSGKQIGGGNSTSSSTPAYSFFQQRSSADKGNSTSLNKSRSGSKASLSAPDSFPSLSDKSLEDRYKKYTHSDGDMQKGMTAVLAELNQSTNDPEKTQQLREVMNYFGTHRQARK